MDLLLRLDEAAHELGIEKIKTVGDAYMAVCGLPEACEDHVPRMMDMALRLMSIASQVRAGDGTPIRLRIGLNTGPVVAGVIGQNKFIYDLWGNTVNIASRLTKEATTGGILVDVTTYRRLRGLYEFEGPEPLKVKGLREITAYRLLGPLNH